MKRAIIFLVLGGVFTPLFIFLMMVRMGSPKINEYAVLLAILLFIVLMPIVTIGWILDELLSDDFTFTILPRAILTAVVGAVAAWGWAFFVLPFASDALYFATGGAVSMGVCSLLANDFGWFGSD